MPHFVSPGQVRRVKHAVTALCRVLDRFCDAYPTDAGLREELQLPDTEDSLIRIEPGFPRPMRICRLDAFLQGYDVKFLEFNADSPAGVGYTDILFEGLRTTIQLPRVRQEFDTTYTRILPELITTLNDAYAHVRATRTDLPETPAARARRRRRLPQRPRVPHHLRRRQGGRHPGRPRHARRGHLRRHDAARQGRAGPARLPPRAARGPRPVRPRRRRARRPHLPRQPVPLAGGQQQEAVRAVPGPALLAPHRGRRGRRHPGARSRGRASCAPAA